MKVKVTQLCLPLCEPMDYIQSTDFSRPEYWSGPAPGGICPTQGSNPGLPHWRRIPYQLSHKGSPRILGWVAYPFSSWSSWPRNQMNQSSLCCRQILYQLSYQGRSWYWQYLTKFKINIILWDPEIPVSGISVYSALTLSTAGDCMYKFILGSIL